MPSTKSFKKIWHKWKNYFLWFLVNGIFCQIPHTAILVFGGDVQFFFPSGLTYLFTLFVASAYMALTIKTESSPTQYINKAILMMWVMIILVVIAFILSTYPEINNPFLKDLLVKQSISSYIWIMSFLLLCAFWVSRPYLDELVKEDLAWIEEETDMHRRMDANFDELKNGDFT